MSVFSQLVKLPLAIPRYAFKPSYRKYLHGRYLERFGYSTQHWNRVIQVQKWNQFFDTLDLPNTRALEISPGQRKSWSVKPFKSYTAVQYPEFNICTDTLDERFDLVIADNVFEHVNAPQDACKNAYSMLEHGGWFAIATPFLYRVHASPFDFHRWTKEGLIEMLTKSGFSKSQIAVDSWGNKKCVQSSLDNWQYYGWGKSLENDPELPMMVWAFAKKD